MKNMYLIKKINKKENITFVNINFVISIGFLILFTILINLGYLLISS